VDLVSMIASGVASPVLSACTVNTLSTFAAREGDHLTICNLAQGGLEANKYWKTMSFEHLESFRAYRSMLRRRIADARGGERIQWTSNRLKHETDGKSILLCVVAGFFPYVAKLQSNGLYKTARENRLVQIHQSSVLARLGKPPDWILFHEAVLMTSSRRSLLDERNTDDNTAVVRIVSAIDPRWLLDAAPHFWKRTSW